MKKIVALLLALLSVLMCFASCSNTPETTIPNTKQPDYVKPTSMEDKFQKSDIEVVYNNFFYYTGNVNPEDYRSNQTIKVQNLKNIQANGSYLYNDPFGNEDPFNMKMPKIKMIVDEKATAENGGMPVLIISQDYEGSTIDDETAIWKHKIVSFNTATNTVTTIADNIENLQDFYLYNNKIYCVALTWDKDSEEPNRIYVVHLMDKDGKNKKEYVLEEKNVCPYLIGVYKGKMYFSQNHNILRSDLDFENSEIIIDDIDCNFTPVFAGGYMYYQGNHRDIDVDSYTVPNCRDLLRRPLNDILNKESEEVVLEGLYLFMRCQESNLYTYCTINELQLINKNDKKTISRSCTHAFDINTGASKLLFDFRDTNTDQTYFVSFLSEEFYIRKGGGAKGVYIKTGKEIDATDIFG